MTAQFISIFVFIGLCIFACFTAFYRNGTLNISAMSAGLMSLFFIVFGITFGVYAGSILYRKSNLLSVVVPAVFASLTTIAMYVGELILMGGVLFSFGRAVIFKPIGPIPFSAIDLIVILIPGVVTYFLMIKINKQKR